MAPKREDLTGKQFGKWTVQRIFDRQGWQWRWWCICHCGNERAVHGNRLKSGDSKSCGCFKNEVSSKRLHRQWTNGELNGKVRLHGLFGTVEWNSWQAAKSRCYKLTDVSYKNYGARGIQMCERWRGSVAAFIEDVGRAPSSPPRYSIDRKDNNGHYSCGKCGECKANGWPMNCQWATYKEQMSNKRKPKYWRGRPIKIKE